MKVDLKYTDVFTDIAEAYDNGHRLIISQGGTRSGKTYAIMLLLFLLALNSKKKIIISVVSRTLPHLKLGAMRDLDNIITDYGLVPESMRNKSESYYKVGKSIIEFFGADQHAKVHGPERDILYANEANFLKYEVYDQLLLRTSGATFIDYNPSQSFWVHDTVIPNEDHVLLKSTYKDNKYCPEGIRDRLDKKLERYYREKKNKTITKAYENWCKVYLFGEVGTLEGAIFENWRFGEPGEVEQAFKDLSFGYALDYGFHPDPDAMSKIAIDYKRKIIYVKELIYTTNNGTDDLAIQMQEHLNGGELIVAESATPRTNYDLKKKGFRNIQPISKTKTVVEWLREMQNYQWVISEESYNLEKELMYYVWNNKGAGVPVDEFNHLIDGARYYYMNQNRSRVKTKAY